MLYISQWPLALRLRSKNDYGCRITRGARSFSGDDEGEKPAAAHERRIEALRRRLLLEDADAPPPPPPLPPSDLKPTTELDLAALGTGDGAGEEAEASQRAMAILRETEGASAFERGALVKTIRNDFWHQFARALDRGDLSPCSLPPPGGVPADPLAGAAALLAEREACLDAGDAACLVGLHEPDSPLLTAPAPWRMPDDGVLEVVQQLGDAWLLRVVSGDEPASVLVMSTEAGWTLRDAWSD